MNERKNFGRRRLCWGIESMTSIRWSLDRFCECNDSVHSVWGMALFVESRPHDCFPHKLFICLRIMIAVIVTAWLYRNPHCFATIRLGSRCWLFQFCINVLRLDLLNFSTFIFLWNGQTMEWRIFMYQMIEDGSRSILYYCVQCFIWNANYLEQASWFWLIIHVYANFAKTILVRDPSKSKPPQTYVVTDF